MNRQALAAALLALLTSAPLDAGLGGSKAIFTCGTEPEPARRTEGRVETGGLSALSFKPDFRGIKPLLIPYKSIIRLEFGPTPGRRAGTLITPPCSLRRHDNYLTVFYKVTADIEEKSEKSEKSDRPESRASREKERQDKKDKKDRDKDKKDKTDKKYDRDPKDQKDRTATEEKKELDEEKVRIAVFQIGEDVLRPTLRILETRSGRRVTYPDASARKAAR
jgi:hypothetical protein